MKTTNDLINNVRAFNNSAGQLIEQLTFNNNHQLTFFSSELHLINFICNKYGLNTESYNDILKAQIISNKTPQ